MVESETEEKRKRAKRLLSLAVIPGILCLWSCGSTRTGGTKREAPAETVPPSVIEEIKNGPRVYGTVSFLGSDRELDLSHESLDVFGLIGALSQTAVERVELGENAPTTDEALALAANCPGVFFRYDTEFFGQRLSTEATEIDLSGVKLKDTFALERELVRFPKLQKLVLCDCGLDDHTLDELNTRLGDTRVVWTVQVYNKGIRTDRDYFIMYNCETTYPRSNGTCAALRYCSDMIAVDVGHFFPTDEDLKFLYGTPKLKYLVAIEGLYTDITPMGSLPELEYLEMFASQARDLTPLLNCKKLQHLNISRCCKLDASCIDVLCQMKQLKRLWFIGNYLSPKYEQVLKDALPDTEIHFIPYRNGFAPYSMDFDWRKDESYYAMRDALHMYYMDNQK